MGNFVLLKGSVYFFHQPLHCTFFTERVSSTKSTTNFFHTKEKQQMAAAIPYHYRPHRSTTNFPITSQKHHQFPHQRGTLPTRREEH
jgi:hypothetical protein